MRPIISDADGTRRIDTPRIVEVERHAGHRHHIVMPEQVTWWERTGPRLAIATVAVALLLAASYWILR